MKKITLLLISIIVLFSASWFAYGKYIEKKLIKSIADYNKDSEIQLQYNSIKMGGFPLGYKYTINDLKVQNEKANLTSKALIRSNLLGKEVYFDLIDNVILQSGDEIYTATFDKFGASLTTSQLLALNIIKGTKVSFAKTAEGEIKFNIANLNLSGKNQKQLLKVEQLTTSISTDYENNFGTAKFGFNGKRFTFSDHFYQLLSDMDVEDLNDYQVLGAMYNQEDRKKLSNNNFEIDIEYKGALGNEVKLVNLSNKSVVFDIKKFKFDSDLTSFDISAKLESKIGKVTEKTKLKDLIHKTNIFYKVHDSKADSSLASSSSRMNFAANMTNFETINNVQLRYKSKANYSEKFYKGMVEYCKNILDSSDPEIQLLKAFISKEDIDLVMPKFHLSGDNVSDINIDYSEVEDLKKLDIKNLQFTNSKYGYQLKGKASLGKNMNANSDVVLSLYKYKKLFSDIFKYSKKLVYIGSKSNPQGEAIYKAMSQENFDKIVDFVEYISDEPVTESDKNLKITLKADSEKFQYMVGRRNLNEIISYGVKLKNEIQEGLVK